MAQKQHSIEDKEVGALWLVLTGPIDHECSLARHGRDLIRKLVEERARYKYADHGKGLSWDDVAASYRWNALNDFGIDQEGWK